MELLERDLTSALDIMVRNRLEPAIAEQLSGRLYCNQVNAMIEGAFRLVGRDPEQHQYCVQACKNRLHDAGVLEAKSLVDWSYYRLLQGSIREVEDYLLRETKGLEHCMIDAPEAIVFLVFTKVKHIPRSATDYVSRIFQRRRLWDLIGLSIDVFTQLHKKDLRLESGMICFTRVDKSRITVRVESGGFVELLYPYEPLNQENVVQYLEDQARVSPASELLVGEKHVFQLIHQPVMDELVADLKRWTQMSSWERLQAAAGQGQCFTKGQLEEYKLEDLSTRDPVFKFTSRNVLGELASDLQQLTGPPSLKRKRAEEEHELWIKQLELLDKEQELSAKEREILQGRIASLGHGSGTPPPQRH